MKSLNRKSNIFMLSLDLFIISFLSLFFQMIFIRWIPAHVHVIGFYTNLVLLACFLGLSAGCILSYKKFRFISLFPLFMLGMVLLIPHFGRIGCIAPTNDYIFEAPPGELALGVSSMVIIVFISTTIIFIFLGQELGKQMSKFRPLVAYLINIGGSILGILCAIAISFLAIQPIVWFTIGLILVLWFFRKSYPLLIGNGVIVLLCLLTLFPKGADEIWSPYYKINVLSLQKETDNRLGYALIVNNQYHQYLLNFGDYLDQTPLVFWRGIYELPYYFCEKATDVLLLGAGAGNDAAISLRKGAENIDAVEIDPIIVKLGKKFHPEKPYENKKVEVHITDARSFLKNTDKKYDLITLGTLDSHTLFSSMSSLRLDNFVYTKEAFQEIKRCLKDNGIVATIMGTPKPWIGQRIYSILKDVFGFPPVIYHIENPFGILVFLNSLNPGVIFRYTKDLPGSVKQISDERFEGIVHLSTDNWPYFYLKGRFIPEEYLNILLFILIFSGILIFIITPKTKTERKFNWHFFFLGSAFMLLETKGIVRLALLFGSTWITSSIVVAAILTMILFATLYVYKSKSININLCYILLLGVIVLNYLFPLGRMVIPNIFLRAIVAGLIVSLPMLLAAIIFAHSFRSVQNVYRCFGINLFGAMFGGVCEYSSLIWGLNNLYILVLVLYLFSWYFHKREFT